MKRLTIILILTAAFTACNQQPKEKEFICPTRLEEVEFFYLEKLSILHVDPNCAKGACTYAKNDQFTIDHNYYGLCGKCICNELARDIFSSVSE